VLHVFWKARSTGTNELDLIVFEGDATFGKVTQSADDNVYALTFESSQEKHFVRPAPLCQSISLSSADRLTSLHVPVAPVLVPGPGRRLRTAGLAHQPDDRRPGLRPASGRLKQHRRALDGLGAERPGLEPPTSNACAPEHVVIDASCAQPDAHGRL